MTAPRAPANRAEMIEVMAHAGLWCPWEKLAPDEQGRLRDVARHLLTALEAAGVRLVPAEATRRMINDGIDALNAGTDAFVGADDAYQAVIAASPYAPEGGA